MSYHNVYEFDTSNSADLVDLRDVTARVEELEAYEETDTEEFDELTDLLNELRGEGGDHKWRGDWYPAVLIADRYFEEYARQYADDLGLIPDDAAGWPANCIDWERAARELQMDYTSVDYAGATYWFR